MPLAPELRAQLAPLALQPLLLGHEALQLRAAPRDETTCCNHITSDQITSFHTISCHSMSYRSTLQLCAAPRDLVARLAASGSG